MSNFEVNPSLFWNASRAEALREFMSRSQTRKFADGKIAKLSIQEYWHADLKPQGSEQMLAYYVAKNSDFLDLEEFATIVFLFESEDDLNEAARFTFKKLQRLPTIANSLFVEEWNYHCSKLNQSPPKLKETLIQKACAIKDQWNCKFYIASGKSSYFACVWSTSA